MHGEPVMMHAEIDPAMNGGAAAQGNYDYEVMGVNPQDIPTSAERDFNAA